MRDGNINRFVDAAGLSELIAVESVVKALLGILHATQRPDEVELMSSTRTEIISIGSEKQLFLDDRWFATESGMTLT